MSVVVLWCDFDADGDEPEIGAPLTHWYGCGRQLRRRGNPSSERKIQSKFPQWSLDVQVRKTRR